MVVEGLSVQEVDQDGSGNWSLANPSVEYLRGSDYGGGIGGVLYTLRNGSPSFNAYNSRGDVISKTDGNGISTWQASYEAFGTRTQEAGATDDRQKANTKDEDPTGLLNEGMRYRDLETGVFITRDPAGFVDGPNVYSYVRQNPWTSFDPLGLWGWNDSNGGVVDAVWNWGRDTIKSTAQLAYDTQPVIGAFDPKVSERNKQRTKGISRMAASGILRAGNPLYQSMNDKLLGAIPGQRDFEKQFVNDFTGGEGNSFSYRATYTGLNVASIFVGDKGVKSALGKSAKVNSAVVKAKVTKVNAPKTVGYHATHADVAPLIRQNGFRQGTAPGRLGSGGTYVNNSRAGAIAEFQHHNPGVTPSVLKVEYNPGINASTNVAPRNYVETFPFNNVDSISAPSVRLPSTTNTNVLNGSVRIVE